MNHSCLAFSTACVSAARSFHTALASPIQQAISKPPTPERMISLAGGWRCRAVVIGAVRESSIATEVKGDKTDNRVFNSNAPYGFARRKSGRVATTSCRRALTVSNDFILLSVVISFPGNGLIVGHAGQLKCGRLPQERLPRCSFFVRFNS